MTDQRARSLVSIRRQVSDEEKRLDWRDPNMPILRRWENGWGNITIRAIEPIEEQEFRQDEMAQRDPLRPTWDRDPSYDWANPKRKIR